MYFVTYSDIVCLCISDLLVMTPVNNGGTSILTERKSVTCLEMEAWLKWDLFLHVNSICEYVSHFQAQL